MLLLLLLLDLVSLPPTSSWTWLRHKDQRQQL
jgi:hypothetical protein